MECDCLCGEYAQKVEKFAHEEDYIRAAASAECKESTAIHEFIKARNEQRNEAAEQSVNN